MIAWLLACAPEPEPARPEPSTLPAPSPAPQPHTTPGPEPAAPTACELRKPGTICRWMGVEGSAVFDPDSAHRLDAYLNLPLDVEFGPDGTPYVIDWNNHRIRVVDPDETVRTILGVGFIGDGIYDPATGTWHDGPGLEYKINHPSGIAFSDTDPTGLYVAAWHNSRVLRYDFDTLLVEHYAGTGARSYGGDGGPLSEVDFDLPSSVAFDPVGNLYVTDHANQVIRRIDPNQVVSTDAGVLKSPGYNGDGPALTTKFAASTGSLPDPSNKAVWWGGALYFVDAENHLVRFLSPAASAITTLAGTWVPHPIAVDKDGDGVMDLQIGLGDYAGDGGPAIEARLNRPRDLAFGPDGSLYVADTDNHCVRVITPDGLIDTFAGTCGVEWSAVAPVEVSRAHDLPAREAELSRPSGVAVDAAGNVYIADTYNHVFRVVWAEAPADADTGG